MDTVPQRYRRPAESGLEISRIAAIFVVDDDIENNGTLSENKGKSTPTINGDLCFGYGTVK